MEKYLEIKWYGRAGQGVLTAAAVLADVLAMEGKHVQAYPDFNNEKNSPFIQAYNRLADSPIRRHSAIEAADIVVIMDPVLVSSAKAHIKSNAKEKAVYIVNTSAAPGLIKEKLDIGDNHIYTLDTDSIAHDEAGKGYSTTNIALMTVLIHYIQWVSMETFKQRLRQSLSRWMSAELAAANLKSVDSVEKGLQEVEQAEVNE